MDNTTDTELKHLMDNTIDNQIFIKIFPSLAVGIFSIAIAAGLCWWCCNSKRGRRERNDQCPKWSPCYYSPDPPYNLKVTNENSSSVTLEWDWKGHDNTNAHFYVEKCEVGPGGQNWKPVAENNREPTYTHKREITVIKPRGEENLFHVIAKECLGSGINATSKPSDPTKVKRSRDLPGSPKELAVKERAAREISLTWKAPDSNGGDAILGYHIEKKEGSALRWNKINESPITDLVYIAGDLKENTSYEFKVLAENRAGEGKPSKSVKTKTKQPLSTEVSEILSNLKVVYNQYLHIKPFPFLEHYAVNLEEHFCSLHLVTRETRKKLRQSKTDVLIPELLSGLTKSRPMELCDIFKADKDGGVPPRRILIEGKPGSGKTSLCVKLANDWSQGEAYIAEKFQGVFFITARDIDVNTGIQGYLREFLNMSPNDAEQVWNCMQDAHHQNSFLFIIDGLDEVSHTLPADECRCIFSNSCVLATSRTNQWRSKLPSFDDQFQFFDREIVNVGFTQETAFAYIDTVGTTVKREESPIETLQEFIHQHKFLVDLIRSPLICIFLCIMWNENYIITDVEENEFRRTVLYANMIDCIVKRYCRQNNIEQSYKLDENELSSATKEKLGQIYKVAYCAFHDQDGVKVQVSIDDVRKYLNRYNIDENDVMFSFGILVKDTVSVNKKGLNEKIVFAFPHRTVQEELSSEFYFYMSEGERVAASKKIVNSFPLMCIFISGLVFYRDSLDPDLLVPLFREMANMKNSENNNILNTSLESVFECGYKPKLTKIIAEKLPVEIALNSPTTSIICGLLKCLSDSTTRVEDVNIRTRGSLKLLINVVDLVSVFKNNNVLRKLLIENCALKLMVKDDDQITGWEALGGAFKANTTLTRLYLGRCEIPDRGWKALFKALKDNTALTQLEVWSCSIADRGWEALGEALKANTTRLTKLNLGYCEIADRGWGALGEALKVNTALTQLNLDECKIPDRGWGALGEALKVNTALTQLDLGLCKIPDRGWRALGEALKVDTALTQLDLRGCDIPDRGWEALDEALKTNTAVTLLGRPKG